MACNYCKTDFYIKTIQYMAPILAPLTHEQELLDKLYNMTGEAYLRIEPNFCPMCGEKLTEADVWMANM